MQTSGFSIKTNITRHTYVVIVTLTLLKFNYVSYKFNFN